MDDYGMIVDEFSAKFVDFSNNRLSYFFDQIIRKLIIAYVVMFSTKSFL